LYPNKQALSYFAQAAGTARFSWNWALAKWQELYKQGIKGLSGYTLDKEFNRIKKDEFPWTSEMSSQVTQVSIQNLGKAFKGFFNGKGYPKFKKRGASKESFYVGLNNSKVVGKFLRIPRLKSSILMAEEVRFSGKIKNAVISKGSDGNWYASFGIELDESYVYPHKCESQARVGVDLGIKTLAVCSDGTRFENPKSYRTRERKIKSLSQSLCRKKRGSSNRMKARIKLACAHARIRRIRLDAIHKMTTSIVKRFRVICIEDLNVKGMLKNHCLAKSVSDASFSEIRRQLAYKSKLSGSELNIVNRFFPSSKLCSDCGHKMEELDLSIREWDCPECGAVHDRDLNAAQNLEKWVALGHRETENACGDGTRRVKVRKNPSTQLFTKQEVTL
jgi:putative transposase